MLRQLTILESFPLQDARSHERQGETRQNVQNLISTLVSYRIVHIRFCLTFVHHANINKGIGDRNEGGLLLRHCSSWGTALKVLYKRYIPNNDYTGLDYPYYTYGLLQRGLIENLIEN